MRLASRQASLLFPLNCLRTRKNRSISGEITAQLEWSKLPVQCRRAFVRPSSLCGPVRPLDEPPLQFSSGAVAWKLLQRMPPL